MSALNEPRIDTTRLRNEIIQLEKLLADKKTKLYIYRLSKMTVPVCDNLLESNNISEITINTDSDNNHWSISYLHTTKNFNAENYIYHLDDDQDPDVKDQTIKNQTVKNPDIKNSNTTNLKQNLNTEVPAYNGKTTKITFGKTNKYFIKGGININVYRNSTGELRIINKEYEYEIDFDEQRNLITDYSNNVDIPEWLAIKVMLYISDNKWNDQSLVIHFSVI